MCRRRIFEHLLAIYFAILRFTLKGNEFSGRKIWGMSRTLCGKQVRLIRLQGLWWRQNAESWLAWIERQWVGLEANWFEIYPLSFNQSQSELDVAVSPQPLLKEADKLALSTAFLSRDYSYRNFLGRRKRKPRLYRKISAAIAAGLATILSAASYLSRASWRHWRHPPVSLVASKGHWPRWCHFS